MGRRNNSNPDPASDGISQREKRAGMATLGSGQVMPVLLDIHQLAKALSVGRTTVEKSTRSRRIPSLKVGRVLRYDLQKVMTALAVYERRAIGQ